MARTASGAVSAAETEAVARRYLDLLMQHDREAAWELIAPDATIVVNGRNVLSGRFTSRVHFLQTYRWVFREFDAVVDPIRCHDLLASDTRAVAIIDERAHRDVRDLEYQRVLIMRIEAGQIVELRALAEDPYQLDAFWE
jgi:ketosteroid isomerase-like protein